MATYEYDDFEICFEPASGGYQLTVRTPDGSTTRGAFTLPFAPGQLESAVMTLGSTRSVTRDVGAVPIDVKVTAEQLGTQLSDALLGPSIREAYERARAAATGQGRGLRLRLSLGDTPALLDVPWELLYLKPTFLASQRRTPIVRFLQTNSPVTPLKIEDQVRILGVIASPVGPAPLDVDAERARVEQAIDKVRREGKVTLDWLQPATPRKLRQALQEGQYHIVHFVGHSEYTASGGVLLLENDDHTPAPVSDNQLVTLIGDQASLRLVVLNSCEGARTSANDPFAGIATSLVALGVPAVVAMQFEITDKAAITFAEELYHSLIARHDPIDAAVAEARKAVFTEVSEVEWATPVLFLRNADGRLFDFAAPATAEDNPRTGEVDTTGPPTLVGLPDPDAELRSKVKKRLIAAAAAVGVLLVGSIVVFSSLGSGDDAATADSTIATSTVDTSATTAAGATTAATATSVATFPTVPGTKISEWIGPRDPSNFIAVAGVEADGETHLSQVSPAGNGGSATTAANVDDIEPAWDPNRNVLAFTRVAGGVSDIRYVVPGFGSRPDGQADKGIQVRKLSKADPATADVTAMDHAPVWRQDGDLLFSRSRGCALGAGCVEDIVRARLTRSGDFVTAATFETVSPDWSEIGRIAVDPTNDDRMAISGRNLSSPGQERGVWIDVIKGGTTFLPGSENAIGATFSPDGTKVVAVEQGTEPGWGPALLVWPADGSAPPTRLDGTDVLGALAGTNGLPSALGARFASIVVSAVDPSQWGVLVADRGVAALPSVIVLDADLHALRVHPTVTAPGDAWVDFAGLAW